MTFFSFCLFFLTVPPCPGNQAVHHQPEHGGDEGAEDVDVAVGDGEHLHLVVAARHNCTPRELTYSNVKLNQHICLSAKFYIFHVKLRHILLNHEIYKN